MERKNNQPGSTEHNKETRERVSIEVGWNKIKEYTENVVDGHIKRGTICVQGVQVTNYDRCGYR